jgi:hypothetical protein
MVDEIVVNLTHDQLYRSNDDVSTDIIQGLWLLAPATRCSYVWPSNIPLSSLLTSYLAAVIVALEVQYCCSISSVARGVCARGSYGRVYPRH